MVLIAILNLPLREIVISMENVYMCKSCSRPAERGFTLIELLIVIAIIGILAGMTLKAISVVREGTNNAITVSEISSLKSAVESYNQDEGEYPAQRKKTSGDDNHFPTLFNALFGERRPKGPGGRNAPYMDLKQDKVVVYDDNIEEYRPAKRKEIYNSKIEKYLLDAWGNPLIYRSNKGRKFDDFMRNRYTVDIYSTGPDGIDQTSEGEDESDDIGNW